MRLMLPFAKKTARPAAFVARQKLRAAVARRTARPPAIEEDEEPTTSFKTALIVMILLHVVFFGGVYMFESIKTHRPAPASAAKKTAPAVTPAAAQTAVAAAPSPAAVQRVKPQPSPAVADAAKKPAVASAPAASEPKDSGQTYIVAKGDNPVAIARKLHVAYDDLLKLNKIENPKNLRVGTKLHVPVKPRAATN